MVVQSTTGLEVYPQGGVGSWPAPPRLGAHSTRKTYAWLQFLRTASVDEVQAALQHMYQSTTFQYLKGGFEFAACNGMLVWDVVKLYHERIE